MEKAMLTTSLGFAGLIVLMQPVEAAQCAPRDQVLAGLATGFDETRRAIGLTGNASGQAQVVEIFASEGGSWTITVTLPDGSTCLVASGQGYEQITEDLPAKGEPA